MSDLTHCDPPQTRAYSSFLRFPSSPSPGSQLGRGPQLSHPWGLLWAVAPETVLSECPQLGLATYVPQDGPGVSVSGSRTSHIKGHCTRRTQRTSVHTGPVSPEEGGLRVGFSPPPRRSLPGPYAGPYLQLFFHHCGLRLILTTHAYREFQHAGRNPLRGPSPLRTLDPDP